MISRTQGGGGGGGWGRPGRDGGSGTKLVIIYSNAIVYKWH